MVGPVTGSGGAHGAQATQSGSNAENVVTGQWFALIALLQGNLAANIYPKFLAACKNDKALSAMLGLLVRKPKDETLSNFLDGWPTVEKEFKDGKLPAGIKALMKIPQFKELFQKLTQMAAIEKRNKNFKKDPQWIKLHNELAGKGGLFDQLNALGVKDPNLVEDASLGAQMASSKQQLLYGQTKLQINLVAQVVQGATTFLNKDIQMKQRIDQQMASSV